MSRIFTLALIGCVLVGGGFAVYHFSGARGEVVKNKLLKEIDNCLGETEVQRTEIDRGIRGMDEGIAKLSEARIKAQIQADMLEKELTGNKKRIEDSKAALIKVRADLSKFDSEPTYTVSYGTTTYSKKDELDKMGKRLIDAHKSLTAQTDSMQERLQTYKTTAGTLEAQETEAKKKLSVMKEKLKQLDSNIAMIKAQKEAAEALSETDKTFADSVAGLEKKIHDLDVKTSTAGRMQKEKWDELTAKNEVEDVKNVIDKSTDTKSEIDKLLGEKN